MSYDGYRPGFARRDSDRSPSYSKNQYSDRPSVSRRDSDRASDYAVDRYRISKSAARGDCEPIQDSRRRSISDNYSRSDPQDVAFKMDPAKAASEVAKRLRLLFEALVNQVKWTNKKDVVLEGYRQRLATYERHGGKSGHEPSVVEAWRKHQDHYKQEEEKIENELAKVNAVIKETTNNFSRLLVECLPIGEIKERQLIDIAKLELAKDRDSAQDDRTSKPEKQLASFSEMHNTMATDICKLKEANEELRTRVSPTADRTRKLEEQMASLLESQKTQEANWDKLKKENEELRTRYASHNAQTADFASLKTQQEQLQLQLSNKTPQDREIETLKQKNEALVSQVSAYETQLANLTKRVDSQTAEFNRSLKEATTQLHTSATSANSTALQKITIVEGQVKALERQVERHEVTLRDFDAEEYAGVVVKLINYPDYSELKRTIQDQQSVMQRLDLKMKGMDSVMESVKLEMSETTKRFTAVKTKSDSDFQQFSDQIIETCGKLVQDLEKQILHMQTRVTSSETQIAAASRGPSAPSTVGLVSPATMDTSLLNQDVYAAGLMEKKTIDTAIQQLREDHSRVQKMLSVLQHEVRDNHNVLEMMIISLDEQFKNLSTVELAGIILDNLKRLPTNITPLDVQNFHERLVDLETFRQEQTRRGAQRKDWMQSWTEDLQTMTKPKRSFAHDDAGLEQPEKRQRMESSNTMDEANVIRDTGVHT